MSEFDQQFPPGWRVWPDIRQRDNESGGSSAHRKNANRRERELDRIAGAEPPKMRSLPLGLLVRLLSEAEDRNRAWLKDFADDLVEIDSDLHDVLMAYERFRQERA